MLWVLKIHLSGKKYVWINYFPVKLLYTTFESKRQRIFFKNPVEEGSHMESILEGSENAKYIFNILFQVYI